MTPGARTQAAIELLNSILTSWQSDKRFPADKQLELYFKSHRYIGSGDRGAIAELVYWILRHKAALEWWAQRVNAPQEARSLVFAALVLRGDYNKDSIHSLTKDSKYSPMPLTDLEQDAVGALLGQKLEHPDMPEDVRLNFPAWLAPQLKETFGKDMEAELRALGTQASTDLRVNTLKTTRDVLLRNLQNEGFDAAPTPLSPVGLRLSKRFPIFTSRYFKEGHFEVQDEGSQLIALLTEAAPGQRVIDFCAGAGGKTLGIAAQMKNKGRILAWDTSEKRLSQIKDRLKRAGVDNVETHVIESESDAFIKRHKQTADRVLVDAPCSGSGTWRRNPDLKWRFNAKDLEEILAVQQSILQSAARLVKPGGRLVYATCSILQNENERQVEQFLKTVKDFRVVPVTKIWDKSNASDETGTVSYLRVSPHQDGVDGFFAAVIERLPGAAQNETTNNNKE